MRKFSVILFLILCFGFTSEAFAFGKKASTEVPPSPPDISEFEGGYVGTLPDPTERFQKLRKKTVHPLFEAVDGFNDPSIIKPTPRDNPAFVNIMIKKDRSSQYVNDVNELIPMLEKVYGCLENGDNIQLLSARAYFFKEHVEYFRQKYELKSEASYLSYKKLVEVSNQTQTVITLLSEKSRFSPYLAYGDQGYIYNDNNVNQQVSYLMQEIQDTLVLLKEVE